jgi:hypothetical protein
MQAPPRHPQAQEIPPLYRSPPAANPRNYGIKLKSRRKALDLHLRSLGARAAEVADHARGDEAGNSTRMTNTTSSSISVKPACAAARPLANWIGCCRRMTRPRACVRMSSSTLLSPHFSGPHRASSLQIGTALALSPARGHVLSRKSGLVPDAAFAQALTITRHHLWLAEQVGNSDELKPEVRPFSHQLRQMTLRLVVAPQLSHRRDQHDVARPLKRRATRRKGRPRSAPRGWGALPKEPLDLVEEAGPGRVSFQQQMTAAF